MEDGVRREDANKSHLLYRAAYEPSVATSEVIIAKIKDFPELMDLIRERMQVPEDAVIHSLKNENYKVDGKLAGKGVELKQRLSDDIALTAEFKKWYQIIHIPVVSVEHGSELFIIYDKTMRYAQIYFAADINRKTKHPQLMGGKMIDSYGVPFGKTIIADLDEKRIFTDPEKSIVSYLDDSRNADFREWTADVTDSRGRHFEISNDADCRIIRGKNNNFDCRIRIISDNGLAEYLDLQMVSDRFCCTYSASYDTGKLTEASVLRTALTDPNGNLSELIKEKMLPYINRNLNTRIGRHYYVLGDGEISIIAWDDAKMRYCRKIYDAAYVADLCTTDKGRDVDRILLNGDKCLSEIYAGGIKDLVSASELCTLRADLRNAEEASMAHELASEIKGINTYDLDTMLTLKDSPDLRERVKNDTDEDKLTVDRVRSIVGYAKNANTETAIYPKRSALIC